MHQSQAFTGLSPEQADYLEYLRKQRARYVNAYRAATLWVMRRDARGWVLFYGRLIRKARKLV